MGVLANGLMMVLVQLAFSDSEDVNLQQVVVGVVSIVIKLLLGIFGFLLTLMYGLRFGIALAVVAVLLRAVYAYLW
jgi:hypothetical protein